MNEVTVRAKVSLNMVCHKCGDPAFIHSQEGTEIKIMPCAKCMTESRIDGIDAGYSEAYEKFGKPNSATASTEKP